MRSDLRALSLKHSIDVRWDDLWAWLVADDRRARLEHGPDTGRLVTTAQQHPHDLVAHGDAR
jgi:hypothetical protein